MPEKDKNEVHFEVDSRVLLQLGEKLITNKSIALAELVKNSYDADATYVRVYLENVKGLNGTIIVEDNGQGMSLPVFKKTWMRIATIDKEENPISMKYKRKKSGEKGIGRLACRRLSKELILKSVAHNPKTKRMEELTATFEWGMFKAGSDLDKVPVEYSVKVVDSNTNTGTELILENLRETWDGYDVGDAQSNLIELISPMTFEEDDERKKAPKEYDPGFDIKFDCPDFPKKEMRFDDVFLKRAWAELEATVDDKGYAKYTLRTKNKIVNEITKNLIRSEKFKHLKSAKLNIHFLVYRGGFFRGKTWSKASEIGKNHGGIRVYANKFRVFGYGGEGEDWLRLNLDRSRSIIKLDDDAMKYSEKEDRPGLNLFRNSTVFGHVTFKSEDNPGLDVTANREWLIDGASLDDLKKFCRLGVDFATVIYSREIILRDEIERREFMAEAKARWKQEEDKRKLAEKERKKAEDLAKKAEIEHLEVETKRRVTEENRRNLEEKRREAEEKRRALEEEFKHKDSITVRNAIAHTQQIEEQLISSEKEAILREKQIIEEEEIKRKKAQEEANKARKLQMYQIEEQIKLREEKEKQFVETKEREIALIRVLASTGTLMMLFNHELGGLIKTMDDLKTFFSEAIENVSKDEKEYFLTLKDEFETKKEMANDLSSLLGLSIKKESRSSKKKWVLLPIISSVFKPFKHYFKKMGIEYKIDIPEDLRSPHMYKAELFSITYNLLSNAVKALNHQKIKKISVHSFEEDDVVHIQFIDSGKGVEKDRRDKVFESFETDSEPDIEFGEGTGLGLKIVRDIAHHYNGDAKFINPEEGWKTCIEITLPLR